MEEVDIKEDYQPIDAESSAQKIPVDIRKEVENKQAELDSKPESANTVQSDTQKDEDELGQAAVGTLDHIFKKTFKDLFDPETKEISNESPEIVVEESTTEEDEDINQVDRYALVKDPDVQDNPGPSIYEDQLSDEEFNEAKTPENDKITCEMNYSSESKRRNIVATESKKVPLEDSEHEIKYREEIANIEEKLQSLNFQANELEHHLFKSRLEAEEEDEKEKSRLYSQGLLSKAEYPRGRSYLKLDKDILKNFGVFGSNLIVSKDLIYENENERLYRIGQSQSKDLGNLLQLRPSTPNYLKGVRKEREKNQHNDKKQKRKTKPTKANKEISTDAKKENEKRLKRMKKRVNFLKNPRFRDETRNIRKRDWKASVLNQNHEEPEYHHNLIKSPQGGGIFHVTPAIAEFSEYKAEGVYETILKIHNTESVSRRLRILPPTTAYFSLSLAVYPSETGTLAPGMACIVKILFRPATLGEYHDYLTIISEREKFRVAIRARRKPPRLSLPKVLNVGCCLTGNESLVVFRCSNSGGQGKFRVFPGKRNSSGETESNCDIEQYFREQNTLNVVDVCPFSIQPQKFSLANGESTNISIKFSPEGEGEIEKHFMLVCDNCQIRTFTIKGTSCKISLGISALDDAIIDLNNELVPQQKTILFQTTTNGAQSERQVSIKNSTPITLPFHWKLTTCEKSAKNKTRKGKTFKRNVAITNNGGSSADVFIIEPSKGNFPPVGCLKFKVKFNPHASKIYRVRAQLRVENVPPSSVNKRDFAMPSGRSLDTSISEITNGERIPASNEAEKDSNQGAKQIDEIELADATCMDVDFYGAGCDPNISVSPAVLYFGGNMLITKRSKNKKDNGDGFNSYYTNEYKPLANTEVIVVPDAGILQSNETIIVQVQVVSHSPGSLDFDLPCIYQSSNLGTSKDSLKTSLRIFGSAVGPLIEFTDPEIDFGLVGVGEEAELQVGVQNTTGIPAKISFHSHEFSQSLNPQWGSYSTSFDSSYEYASECKDSQNSDIIFEPETCLLEPNGKIFVNMKCVAGWSPERLRKAVECKVENSFSSFIKVRGEIQSPKVYIKSDMLKSGKGTLELGTTYVTVPVTNTFTLVNLSNLHAKFCWKEIVMESQNMKYDATFSEESGILEPKEHRIIYFTYEAKKAGRYATLFACEVEGMPHPLGFGLKTASKGLSVSYSLADQNASYSDQNQHGFSNSLQTDLSNSTKIPLLDFGNELPLCHRRTLRLCLTNHSAIQANFSLNIKHFAASSVPPSLQDSLRSSSRSDASRGRVSASGGSRGNCSTAASHMSMKSVLSKRLLGDCHEKTKVYISKDGSEYIIQKLQAAEDKEVLANGEGVAFLAHPSNGVLKAWQSIVVDIVCFNNMPGRYKSELVCNVDGLAPTKIPIKVKVVGCPLELSRNTVGLNMNQANPNLNFSSSLVGTDVVHKIIKIVNNGPVDSILNWHVKKKRPLDSDLVQLKLQFDEQALSQDKNAHRVMATILPHPDLSNPPPFEVCPYQQRVPAHSFASFRVTYAPNLLHESEDAAVMVADSDWVDENSEIVSLKLCNSKATMSTMATTSSSIITSASNASLSSGSSLMTSVGDKTKRESMKGILKLDLIACTSRPSLELDRSIRQDGLRRVLFSVLSTEISTNLKSSSLYKMITFTNSGSMPLNCELMITPPFHIVKVTASGESSVSCQPGHENTYHVARGEKLAIKINFTPAAQLNPQGLDINEILQSTTKGMFTVKFDNGDEEQVRLEATVLRPTVEIQPAQHNCRLVHVETKSRVELRLGNPTVVPAEWKIKHIPAPDEDSQIDDPSCWKFERSDGVIQGPTIPLTLENLNLPQGLDEEGKQKPTSIPVQFAPKQRGKYRSRFRFMVRTGVPFDVLLEGEGSYEEIHDYSVKKILAPSPTDDSDFTS